MSPRPKIAAPARIAPEFVADDGVPRGRHSLSALLLGLLLWLIVRPVLRQISDLGSCRSCMLRLDWRTPFRNGPAPQFAGVSSHFVEPEAATRVILYVHGGGFFMHPTSTHVAFLQQLCADTNARGILPAYRLAPEHPFPQGLDDCLCVYRELLAQGVPAQSIIVAGDSAGGTLSLSLLMRIRDAGLPLPACAVLISPATDLAGLGIHASYRENGARDALVPPDALQHIVRAYAADHDPADPKISPLHGEFAGLPPLHFVASRDEVLRDDSVLAAAKAHRAGVEVEIKLWRGMMHTFPLFNRLPEAQAARAEIASFVCAHTAEHPAQPALTFTDEVPA